MKIKWLQTLLIVLAVIIFINFAYFNRWDEELFGTGDESLGKFISLVMAVVGGVFVALQLVLNNRRIKIQIKQNEIAEQAQLNTRFKDAALLLADKSSSANMSGVYALHQIAMESAQSEKSKGYISLVHGVLCAFVREHYNRDVYDVPYEPFESRFGRKTSIKDQEKNEAEYKAKLTARKPKDLLQLILKLIFFQEGNVYANNRARLQECYFYKLEMKNLLIEDADFTGSKIEDCTLDNVGFIKVDLVDVIFDHNTLDGVVFSESNLENMDIEESNETDITIIDCKNVGTGTLKGNDDVDDNDWQSLIKEIPISN